MGSSTSCVHSRGILQLFIFGVMSKLLLYNQAVGEAFGIKVSLRISQQQERVWSHEISQIEWWKVWRSRGRTGEKHDRRRKVLRLKILRNSCWLRRGVFCTQTPKFSTCKVIPNFLCEILSHQRRQKWEMFAQCWKPQARTNFVMVSSLQAQPACFNQSWNDAAFIWLKNQPLFSYWSWICVDFITVLDSHNTNDWWARSVPHPWMC